MRQIPIKLSRKLAKKFRWEGCTVLHLSCNSYWRRRLTGVTSVVLVSNVAYMHRRVVNVEVVKTPENHPRVRTPYAYQVTLSKELGFREKIDLPQPPDGYSTSNPVLNQSQELCRSPVERVE